MNEKRVERKVSANINNLLFDFFFGFCEGAEWSFTVEKGAANITFSLIENNYAFQKVYARFVKRFAAQHFFFTKKWKFMEIVWLALRFWIWSIDSNLILLNFPVNRKNKTLLLLALLFSFFDLFISCKQPKTIENNLQFVCTVHAWQAIYKHSRPTRRIWLTRFFAFLIIQSPFWK